MVTVTARLVDGVTELRVEGHTESRVCAAITAITQTCLLGLQAYAEQYPDLVSMSITEENTP